VLIVLIVASVVWAGLGVTLGTFLGALLVAGALFGVALLLAALLLAALLLADGG
jgi:hypothetical protein